MVLRTVRLFRCYLQGPVVKAQKHVIGQAGRQAGRQAGGGDLLWHSAPHTLFERAAVVHAGVGKWISGNRYWC